LIYVGNLILDIDVPHRVRITSADVTQGADGKIHVILDPASATGSFTLQLLSPASHTILNSVSRSGGERDEGFGIPSLSNGEYTQVKATWVVNSIPQYGTYPYHIKVLGNYNHTQYNVPDESLCSGTAQAIKYTGPGTCSYLANCDSSDSTAKSGWISEVAENGSAKHSTLGFVTIEGLWALVPAPKYRDLSSGEGCPYCSGESLTANSTVAINGSNPDLTCGDSVFVYHIQGQTSGVRRVTDHGGGVGLTQLDHYVGPGACNAATTIGLRMTIKLY
jgi:hypothetical protein